MVGMDAKEAYTADSKGRPTIIENKSTEEYIELLNKHKENLKDNYTNLVLAGGTWLSLPFGVYFLTNLLTRGDSALSTLMALSAFVVLSYFVGQGIIGLGSTDYGISHDITYNRAEIKYYENILKSRK